MGCMDITIMRLELKWQWAVSDVRGNVLVLTVLLPSNPIIHSVMKYDHAIYDAERVNM
jgi:hypothetical protein